MSEVGAAAVALAISTGAGWAQGAAKPDLQITGSVAGATNYVFRGFSQSAQNPVVQASVDVSYKLFYIGAWGSGIDYGRDPGITWGRDIAHKEIDYYAGVKPVLGPVTFDLGIIYDSYPGALDGHGATVYRTIDYYEFKAGASMTAWKDATVGATAFYSPGYTNNTGPVTTLEGAFSQVLPKVGPIVPTFGATLGYQTGSDTRYRRLYANNAADNILYWNAGLTLGFGDRLSLDIRYWDTNIKDNNLAGGGSANFCTGATFRCDDRIVATAKVTF